MNRIFTAEKYVAWLKAQAAAKRPYWYGTTYVPCTESLLKSKTKQYPAHYGASRMARYRADIAAGQTCGDCVGGAIKGAAWSELGAHKTKYASGGVPDTSADGMFAFCKKQGADWGAIATLPERPGVALRRSGHVGVYIGSGRAVEWRGFAYGCVITRVQDRDWTHWYELPWVDYGSESGTGSGSGAASGSGAGAGSGAGSGSGTGAGSGAVSGSGTGSGSGAGSGSGTDSGSGAASGSGAGAGSGAASALLGARLLKKGCKGEDVRQLQQALMSLGYDLPKYGADGSFGDETERALMQLQKSASIEADGRYGDESHAALMGLLAEADADEEPAAPAAGKIRITGGSVYVRAGAGTNYRILTVAHRGDELAYTARAENGWYAVRLADGDGWVSGRYAEVVA